ncbi:MAG: hypothetical protein ACI8YQ_001303 [Polaribacter sp.]|jgi:hypothetical protein
MKNISWINRFPILWVLILAITTTSCYDYEVQEEGAYTDEGNGEIALGNAIVFTAGGNVFLMDEFGLEITRFYNGGDVETASISHDHKKVLYKPAGENIKIYDVENETNDGELPNTENAKWFDYHPNNETAFAVVGDNINTFGPNVFTSNTVNLENLNGIPANIQVYTAALLQNGTIVFAYQNQGNSDFFVALANESTLIVEDFNLTEINHLRVNVSETKLWTSSEISDDLLKYNLPSLNLFEVDIFHDFGVPTINGNGIEVSDDQISLPEPKVVNPDKGVITSIDF